MHQLSARLIYHVGTFVSYALSQILDLIYNEIQQF